MTTLTFWVTKDGGAPTEIGCLKVETVDSETIVKLVDPAFVDGEETVV